MDNKQHTNQEIHPSAGMGSEEEGLSIWEVAAYFLEYRWLVLAITLAAMALGVVWVLASKPVFRAAGLVQIEEKAAAGLDALKDIGPLIGLGGDTTVAAELEILTSRMILARVIEKQRLNIFVEPKYFPILGRILSKRAESGVLSDPFLGMATYAWGGEVIAVESLDVPKGMLDKEHILVMKDGGRFDLVDEDNAVVLSGKRGERASSGGYSIFVSKLDARPQTSFTVIRFSQEAAMDALLKRYAIKERGKKSGILEVSLLGEDQGQITAVLDDVLNTYVRQNVERRSAESENTLKFLETQLPAVKRQLDMAEAAYNTYRQSRGSLDLGIETQSVLASIVEIDNQVVALKQQKDELRQYFTQEHPRILAVDAQLQKLRERRSVFDGNISKLPDTQQRVLQLARDVEVSTTLYTNLVNTSQQLRVSKAGTVGDVRVVDSAAVSAQPVGMKPVAVIVIALLVGFFLSVVAIWMLRSLRVVVETPDDIETKLGLPVYATIPHSNVEAANTRKKDGASGLLALSNPDDDAIESLRSLRTTLHFALMDAESNSVLITGSSPSLGKSFISKNLGVVLAQSGKRVVVVDADLRRGHINKEFGLGREVGVSEYVVGSSSLNAIVKPTLVPNLWVVTTGQIPPNPSELLMHNRFGELIVELGKMFDVLIVDAPPILAVSDAAIIGRHVGATLMIARAGKHPIKELEQAVKRMVHAGVAVKGFVFNGLDLSKQRYRYGYAGYVYKYSYNTK